MPDEEIGLCGAKALDLHQCFNVDFAWTIDCCELGDVVYENVNAAAAEIIFTGVPAHPMAAKGVLVNPLLMAHDFIACFDRQQTPEHTAGREGYIWFNEISANASEARLKTSIRDFDLANAAQRKQQIAARYPTGNVTVTLSNIYSNISNAIGDDRRAIDLIFSALTELEFGVTVADITRVKSELATQRLVAPCARSVKTGAVYSLICREGKRMPPHLATLVAWLCPPC